MWPNFGWSRRASRPVRLSRSGARLKPRVRSLIEHPMGTRKTAKITHHDNEPLALRQRLKAEPHHHWLLTRLSSEYYEKRQYALALKYAEKAFTEVPSCPLVLWDYAGALQMLPLQKCLLRDPPPPS